MFRKTKLIVMMMLLAAFAVVGSVFAADIPREDLPNVVEIAVSNDDFETLVTAVTAAGLADALTGDGPFTVFAPTDEAFAKLPAGTLNALLNDKDALTQVLLYHVVSGDIGSDIAAAVAAGSGAATTLNGEPLRVKVFDGDIYLNDNSKVIAADILASNGKIHVIDTVLLPPSMMSDDGEMMAAAPAASSGNTIVDIAVADGRFDTLVAAVSAAGLVDTLSGEGPFTVFAPTDDAFAKLPAGTINALLRDPQGALTDILLYHVVSGNVTSADALGAVADGTAVPTVGGPTLSLKFFDGDIYINDDSKIIITDIVADNGVIHVIDTVLLPPADE